MSESSPDCIQWLIKTQVGRFHSQERGRLVAGGNLPKLFGVWLGQCLIVVAVIQIIRGHVGVLFDDFL